MIEPVFAHTKFNRRIDRFQRRGRAAARSEWRLITATHNLLKLHTHTLAASRRLRAPAARAALRAAINADTGATPDPRTFARQPPWIRAVSPPLLHFHQ